MIKTIEQYDKSIKELATLRNTISTMYEELIKADLDEESLATALSPIEHFANNLEDEILFYENVIAGNISSIKNVPIYKLLEAKRIYLEMSLQELSRKIELEVTRLEYLTRNEFYGISLGELQDIMIALKMDII